MHKAPLNIHEVYKGNQTKASKKKTKKSHKTLQIAEKPRPKAQTLNPPKTP